MKWQLGWAARRMRQCLAAGIAMAVGLFGSLAMAQSAPDSSVPPRMPAWVAMFRREAAVTDPLIARWHLPSYVESYCHSEMSAAHENDPKNGSIPFGVVNWDSLSDHDFNLSLGSLESWHKGFMVRCLADFRGKLDGAK